MLRSLLLLLLLISAVKLPAQCWKQVCASRFFTLAIRTDGSLWAWGNNTDGQLGNDLNLQRNVPALLDSSHAWVEVAAGWSHALALKADGTLWGWGDNRDGQLYGPEYYDHPLGLTRIGVDDDWMSVAANLHYSAALKKDGTLWAWGGDIADFIASTLQESGPQRVDTASNCIKIAVGHKHLAVLKKDGSLWTCGFNDSGQMGIGSVANSPMLVRVEASNTWPWTDVAAGGALTVALKADGSFWGWGRNMINRLEGPPRSDSYLPRQLDHRNDWVKLTAGFDHGLLVDSKGYLWAWGSNSFGELGIGHDLYTNSLSLVRTPMPDAWLSLSAGIAHSAAIDSKGNLFVWGNNDHGALGDGTDVPKYTPTGIPCDPLPQDLSTAKLSLYPNPVQDELTIKIDDIFTQHLQYEVQNTLGQLIVSRQPVPESFRIDVRNLPRDHYLLYIFNESARAARFFTKW